MKNRKDKLTNVGDVQFFEDCWSLGVRFLALATVPDRHQGYLDPTTTKKVIEAVYKGMNNYCLKSVAIPIDVFDFDVVEKVLIKLIPTDVFNQSVRTNYASILYHVEEILLVAPEGMLDMNNQKTKIEEKTELNINYNSEGKNLFIVFLAQPIQKLTDEQLNNFKPSDTLIGTWCFWPSKQPSKELTRSQ